MPKDIANFITGSWRAPRGERRYRRVNPAYHDQVIADYALSSVADVDDAVASAAAALDAWRGMTAVGRGGILRRAADILRSRQNDLASVLVREIGKNRTEANGELAAAANLLDLYGSEGVRFGGDVIPSSRPGTHLFAERRPIGVCGLITPWNYPVSIPVWKIGPALLCGNTVVWKPALQHPYCSQAVIEVLLEAGLPAGVVNLVHGDGPEVGHALVNHPAVAAVSFTGSRAVGQTIYRDTTHRLARASCEMGGKNPILVLADADLALAAQHALEGGMSYSGQKCTGTDRVIVERGVMKEFTDILLDKVARVRVGDPSQPDVFVGPLIDEAQHLRVLGMLRHAIGQGARPLCGGADVLDHKGYYVQPTVLGRVDRDQEIARHEIFGPVLTLFSVDDLEEGIRVANDTGYGLSASIFTRNLTHAFRFIDRVDTGLTYVNRPTAGAEFQAPFGGIKDSGLGVTEQGLKVLEFYSHWRTVAIQFDPA